MNSLENFLYKAGNPGFNRTLVILCVIPCLFCSLVNSELNYGMFYSNMTLFLQFFALISVSSFAEYFGIEFGIRRGDLF